MTTIVLPPEIEGPLAEEAHRRGTTPELLAIDCLRELFVSRQSSEAMKEGGTLFDFLSGYIGTIDGSGEAWSEETGRRFTEGLVEKRDRGRA